jgi:hypothetical protein
MAAIIKMLEYNIFSLGGMLTSTALTLLVLPCLFKLFGQKALKAEKAPEDQPRSLFCARQCHHIRCPSIKKKHRMRLPGIQSNAE